MAAGFWQRLSGEYGLQYEDKRLYGRLGGYSMTLSSLMGSAFRLQVYLPELNPAHGEQDAETLQKAALLRAEAIRVIEDALKEHKLARMHTESSAQGIALEFRRTGRAVKHMGDVLKAVASGLAALGLPASKICSHCGETIEMGEVPVRIKYDVFPMHDGCADAVLRQSDSEPEAKTGSLLAGALGALLAAIVGSIPWAAIFAAGYMASIVGLLIGIMVNKGYDLFRGRQGRAKIVIVVLCVILSVALGQFLGTSYGLAKAYDEVEAGLSWRETMTMPKGEFIFWAWPNAILADDAARREVFSNFGLGVFFAFLGTSGMVIGILRDTAPSKPKRLSAAR